LATSAIATEVEIHPFFTDKPIHSEGGRWTYFFQLPHGLGLSSDGSFTIDYDTSPTLSSTDESLTVILNGQPVDSRSIGVANPGPEHWQVRLPKNYCKGGFNEVSVVVRGLTRLGPCTEDDDMKNWVRFHDTSVIRLNLAEPGAVPLNAYPFPYLNWLSHPVTTAAIAVGPTARDGSISAALNIAAGWGHRITDQPLILKMTRSAIRSAAVHVGTPAELGRKADSEIQVDNSDLWITGRDKAVLDACVTSLNTPDIVTQMNGFTASPMDIAPKAPLGAPRLGVTTFEELGYPSISLAGVGSQGTAIVLRRPLLVKIGRGGQLRLRFRHAATLVRTHSMLSIAINGQQIGSSLLTPDNANDGELVCPLPINLADSNQWNIEITSHNELANVDCSKRYEDIAWTTVLGMSDFELQEGTLPNTPFLEGFPYFRASDGSLPHTLTANVGPKPSTEVLSCAATTVARAAQTNNGTTSWHATSGDVAGDEDLVVGLFRQEKRFHNVLSSMLVAPSESGVPVVKGGIPILPSSLVGAVVIEAVAKPSGGVAYVVLGASNAALDRFTQYLANPEVGGMLKGQVAVFTRDGEIFSFDTLTAAERRAAEQAEMRRYKPEMILGMTSVLVLLTAVLGFLGSKFIKKKKVT